MTDNLIRLNKYIADSGVASRRRAERLIVNGQVKVNNNLVKILGTKIDPDRDVVVVSGKKVQPSNKMLTVIYYKPKGLISTTKISREKGRALTDAIKIKQRLVIAGRLDKDAEGMIILTTDGQLALQITHPRYKHEKEYVVDTQEFIKDSVLRRMKRGLHVNKQLLKAKTAWLSGDKQMHLVLTEGRKHHIKRLAAAVGLTVIKLKRVRIGKLRLKNLKPGEYNSLNQDEIKALVS
ncbi:pseudouridine synthase [Patescibacteria group bacterium]